MAAASSQILVDGCPLSAYQSLQSVCSQPAPSCLAVTTSINYDANCCGAILSYDNAILSCYSQHPLACLTISSTPTGAAGTATVTNPCAAYATAGSSPSSGGAAVTGSSAGGSAATTGSSSSTSAKPTSASPPRVGAGLKVYLGIALVGALSLLTL